MHAYLFSGYVLSLSFYLYRLGEGCSHIAAVMFKVECAVRLGYTSSTSQVCKWNETFCNKVSFFCDSAPMIFTLLFFLDSAITHHHKHSV